MLFNKASFYSKVRFVGRELLYSYVTRKLVASQHKKFGIFKNEGGGDSQLSGGYGWMVDSASYVSL